jgi:DNA-binding CsgD family transcriptional regulator
MVSGDLVGAYPFLHRVADALEATGAREPSIPGVLPLAIEAAAGSGQHPVAEALCDRLHAQAESLHSRWGRAGVLCGRAHIRLAERDFAAAAEAFDEAAAAYAEIDLPLRQGRALFAGGRAQVRLGRRRAARSRVERSVAAFERAGAEGLRAQACRELAALDTRLDVLTATESQAAALAAAGLRNTEIALRLHLSPKTVEHHLGQVYRKLGVRGRGELSAALRADR